jgi:hypothetical protein
MDEWRYTLMEFLRRVLDSCPFTTEQKLTAEAEGKLVAWEMVRGTREEDEDDDE